MIMIIDVDDMKNLKKIIFPCFLLFWNSRFPKTIVERVFIREV